ncbi:Protein GUK-1 b [Aphelenchoides avenae]|nr:Protein GUK-1 b [Aphelenchus avenae]
MSPCVRPIVISGPSGSGKSTILVKVMERHPKMFAFSVSHTTRSPRPGELDGEHYHFVAPSEMQRMIEKGDFLEYAQFGGNIYGTSKEAVTQVQKTGRICILDLELNGVRNIKKSHLEAKFIMIRAPSIKELENRLRKRGTESEESISKRLKHAEEDLQAIAEDPSLFDHVIVNDDFDKAYEEFVSCISDEMRMLEQSLETTKKNGTN